MRSDAEIGAFHHTDPLTQSLSRALGLGDFHAWKRCASCQHSMPAEKRTFDGTRREGLFEILEERD